MNLTISDIDTRSIIKDLVKNAFFIFLAALTGFFAVFGYYTLSYKPEYTSTSVLSVNIKSNNGTTYSSLYLTKEMAGIFTEVFESSALRKRIAADIGVESVNGTISVDIIEETNLISLKVVSDTPKNAYLIINSALNNYENVSDYLFTNANLDILKNPTIPYSPSNTQSIKNQCVLAGLLAAFAVAAAVALLSFIRPTVKNTKSAKKNLDGKIIGVIPYARKYKKGVSPVKKKDRKKIAALITSFEMGMPFIEATKRISTIIRHTMQRNGNKIITVTSVAENEGKSTFAANMALSISQKNFRVLLIDADLKKPAMHKIFEQTDSDHPSFSDVTEGEADFEKLPVKINDNFDCIFQYRFFHDSAEKLADPSIDKLMEYCKENYDFIILDTPPVCFASDFEALLKHSDAAAIVVRQDWADIGSINDVSDIIHSHKKDFIGYILNSFIVSPYTNINQYDYGYKYGRYGYGYGYGKTEVNKNGREKH